MPVVFRNITQMLVSSAPSPQTALQGPPGDAPVQAHRKLANLQKVIGERIIGQHALIRNMLICLLCDGHILIEGMPGLAKTTAAKALAEGVEGDFHRVQFTPDLLPSDLIGTEIYVHEMSDFTFRHGPIFNNIVMADEINRAPAKVQSALLEAMEEKQVTVGHHTYKLPELYMVLATQNPIEQEGTYNLPEAQLDRFLMYTIVGYPTPEEERRILDYDENRRGKTAHSAPATVSTQVELFAARRACAEIHVDEKLKQYVVSLVSATRTPLDYDAKLAGWIRHGASPRTPDSGRARPDGVRLRQDPNRVPAGFKKRLLWQLWGCSFDLLEVMNEQSPLEQRMDLLKKIPI